MHFNCHAQAGGRNQPSQITLTDEFPIKETEIVGLAIEIDAIVVLNCCHGIALRRDTRLTPSPQPSRTGAFEQSSGPPTKSLTISPPCGPTTSTPLLSTGRLSDKRCFQLASRCLRCPMRTPGIAVRVHR